MILRSRQKLYLKEAIIENSTEHFKITTTYKIITVLTLLFMN